MGRSITVAVIGITNNGAVYCAMNKIEMAQVKHKALKRGENIRSWYAQTEKGLKSIESYLKISPKLITCPVCNDEGKNGEYYCPICAGSGICRPGNEHHWQPWQIEDMKANRRHEGKK